MLSSGLAVTIQCLMLLSSEYCYPQDVRLQFNVVILRILLSSECCYPRNVVVILRMCHYNSLLNVVVLRMCRYDSLLNVIPWGIAVTIDVVLLAT